MHPLFHPLYVDYCTYFNGNQDYFECHEVLEEYWKLISPGDKAHPLVGYVQLATGMYHWRRNNTAGAMKILKKATNNFSNNHSSPFFEFLDYDELYNHCETSIISIEKGEKFKPFSLTFTNEDFAALVNQKIGELPTIPYDYLLNKHMLRDRTDILEARNEKRRRGGR
ncbi:DUF309 domain-containing protein [Lysinibacillus telephonicus]|uniref:DUF309 domain-containing protein n=1 Tax=Lysinibacillus telephonicus TaxID=1714840 RepID=A0A3S0HF46_9BACI|nr:DUF309 domain-containing protein [Lysinibacillus telephonicus]RTQ90071.1 DUF309 domain-containing protein [Lysinibacillus telephonicus]